MVEQQLEALKSSIVHWEKNLERVRGQKLPRIGAGDCACCDIWLYHYCEGCPILEYTGETDCEDTPYRDVSRQCSILNYDPRDPHLWFILESFVQAEIDFLKKVYDELEVRTKASVEGLDQEVEEESEARRV